MFKRMMKTVLHNITITDILETINKHYGSAPALRIKEKDGAFRTLTYVRLGERAVDVSSTLLKLGLEKNDRVAIFSESRPEWAIAFFAVVSGGGIIVPLDIKLTEREVQFILTDSQAKFVLVSEKYLGLLDNLRGVLPHLKDIILFDDSARKDVIVLKDLKMKEGEAKYNPIYPTDTALIVYTSGTTGVAKGVEISYKNLLFQVLALSDIIRYRAGDQFLSILPLNHMLEITGGLIAPLYAGACVTYSDSLRTPNLIALMQETHTKTMICVPLILKMLRDGIMKKVEKLPAARQKIFQILFGLSKFFLRFNIRIGRLFFPSLHKEFGGKLKGFVSGGAPLAGDLEIEMNALGFRVLQGYGLTETAPVISVNTYAHNKYGSVGRPLPGVEVKILKAEEHSPDGEIIVRGPNVMKGYFQNPEKTAEILQDGWLHTGDIGYLDRQGYLHISGRIRNLIVLGGGKKVFPEEVEEVMAKSPFIKEICVLGRIATKGLRKGCEEVYAVVVPNLDFFPSEERQDVARVRENIEKEINRLSENLAEYKRIMDFEIWNEELPKTATRKIKRKAVADKININV